MDKLGGDGANKAAKLPKRNSADILPSSPNDTATKEKTRSTNITSGDVQINLERLKYSGYLVPNDTSTELLEQFRAIKRPLLKNAYGEFSTPINKLNLIMVTSALAGEGKSFTSINLAISIAMEMDHTVLLVEGDLAKPSITKYLGIGEERRGLIDYLAEDNFKLSEVMLKTNIPKLTLLPAGNRRQHTSELVASANMRQLMHDLSTRYHDRIVIFDTPPMLQSNEAVTLASQVGQIALVVESGKTPQSAVLDALKLIDGNQVVGVILNKSTGKASSGYGAYGYYGS